jgi:hypothetical protein
MKKSAPMVLLYLLQATKAPQNGYLEYVCISAIVIKEIISALS